MYNVCMPDEVISLINQCLDNCGDSWNTFVREYARIAMNILNSGFSSIEAHEKDDIIQNVFSKLFNSGLRNFRGTTKYEFLAYFKTIVTNEAKTFLKADKNKHAALSLDDEDAGPTDIPTETTRPDRLSDYTPRTNFQMK